MHRNGLKLKMYCIALSMLALSAAAGCTDAGLDNQTGPEVKLSAAGRTPGEMTELLLLDVAPQGEGYSVTVTAGPQCPELSELFLNLSYDAENFHAEGAPGAVNAGEGMLGLAVESQPGSVDAGFVKAGDAGSQVGPGDVLLQLELLPGRAGKSVSSAAEGTPFRARNLELARGGDEAWTLSWDYTNPGDTNQDGEVGISDLSPVGNFFQQQLDSVWGDPLRNVDADHNGEINTADITPIGSNYTCDIVAYKIQMSADGESEYITVGELLLSEQDATPVEAVRFNYTFGAQYVPGAWYRVRPQSRDLSLGEPSEAICESGRQLTDLPTEAGNKLTVIASAQNLPHPITHMNAVRVTYPASFSYVEDSYNLGSPGGKRDAVDGLWATFTDTVLFPPESFMEELDLGNGFKAMDFNVTTLDRSLPASPAGFGDLFNFQLESDGGEPLNLQVQIETDDGIKRTYFTDMDDQAYLFGSSLSFTAY